MSDSIQKFGNGQEKNSYENLPAFTLDQSYESGDSDPFNPRKVISILFRYKWLILFFLIIGGTGAWFYAQHVTPIYESKGTLMISAGPSGDDDLSRIISQTTGVGTSSTIANELQVLRSREFARQIAIQLMEEESDSREEFPILWSEDEEGNVSRASEGAVTNRVRRNLTVVRPERDSDLIELAFQSTSSQEAAHIANAAMDIYIERSTMQNRQAAESTAQFLEQEKEQIKRRLDESEQRLKSFMDNTGIVRVDEQASGIVSQQAEVEAELQRINLELETINQAINNHERQLEQIKPGLAEQFSEAIGPRIRNSQEQLAQYEAERTMILVRNPGVRDREETPPRLRYLDENIDRLKGEIQELSAQLFTEDDDYMGMDTADRAQMVAQIQTRLVELRIERNQNESRREALTERKQEIDQSFNNLPDGMMELARLQRDVQMNEELYVNVSKKHADMSVLKESQFGFGRIVDTALIPSTPVYPNNMLLILLGIMISGAVVVGFIMLKEFFDNSINSVEQLNSISLPVLSAVPTLKKKSGKKMLFKDGGREVPNELVLLQDRASVVSESIRRLKNNIVYQYADKPPKTMAVTSPEKGDGKSTIVANLGIAFAEEGYKTLVVDTDFRRPRLHTYYGMSNKDGLTDYLRGKLPLQDLLQSSELNNLKVVTSGSSTSRPQVLVSTREFKQFLKRMEEIFEVIILDTPPYGIISDSTALLKYAEATLVVAKYRKTNRGVFIKTIKELKRINANVNGIVLNDFDHTKEPAGDYGSGYYQTMYENYESYAS